MEIENQMKPIWIYFYVSKSKRYRVDEDEENLNTSKSSINLESASPNSVKRKEKFHAIEPVLMSLTTQCIIYFSKMLKIDPKLSSSE